MSAFPSFKPGVDVNRGVARGHLFLARQARWVAPPHADDLEEQELLHLTRAQLESALMAGEFKVLAWTAAIALALRHDEFESQSGG